MALASGTRLGSFEVTAVLGVGGMGEVYRARDTRLKRDVALKILPQSFAADPERLARFQREAEVLAALNHPHIAQIYGLEQADGISALVLELVDGETLADRIRRGAIPLDEALPIARQVAEALEAAHEQGIVHRDLKPANIKVREDATVKVLDFGLAKALGPPEGGHYVHDRSVRLQPDLTDSPTITSPALMTGIGTLLGTAAYMAPEQAKGKPADRRSDVWAFGCVLYEMLTGRRTFEGEDVADTLADVLKADPDWDLLPATLPSSIRRLLRRSLDKDRRRRLSDISVARLEIEDALSGASPDTTSVTLLRTRPKWRTALPWTTTAILAAGLVAVIGLWAPWQSAQPSAPVRLESTLGVDASLAALQQGASIALSPDGRMLAFVAQTTSTAPSQLYVRRLDQLQATALTGTDGAFGPFFSPDGQWIAFFANGKLAKIAVSGGALVTLCDALNGRGGTWFDDGTITFRPTGTASDGGRLLRVSAAGGTPEPLTTPGERELTHRFPQILPGGKAVLYTADTIPGDAESSTIIVQALPSGMRKVLVHSAYYGRYLSSGHLVYVRGGTLFAAPFDVDRLELTGESVPALEGAASSTTSGAAQFAVSANGIFVYVPGQTASAAAAPIAWMDRSGKTLTLRAHPANWSNPAFAPDGLRLAIDINEGKTDVWVYEWARDTLSRLTFDPVAAGWPLWTPDGQRIVFSSMRGDTKTFNLYWQRADGAGDVERLTESTYIQVPGSWHPGGQFLAFLEAERGNGNIMILPMEGDARAGWRPGRPTVFVNTPAIEWQPQFSPDGKWLAYTSNESGRNEVYVRPFPGPGGKWQISTNGGGDPLWSRTGPELFFATVDQRIMIATYTADGDSFRPGRPQLVSEARFTVRRGGTTMRNLDLHPDGQRFVVAPAVDESAVKQDKIVFIFNFFDELRRIAPGTK